VRLANKLALIAGGGRSIGRAIALVSAREGADVAQKTLTHYQATKAGVETLARGMGLELAEYDIRVNRVEPGLIETDLNRTRLADSEKRRQRLDTIPFGRLGSPDDLVGAALYFVSDESRYAKGSAIRVDGRQSVW
jgi:3-oxoacyl-[acyl-carrier protein] reductase